MLFLPFDPITGLIDKGAQYSNGLILKQILCHSSCTCRLITNKFFTEFKS